MNVNAEVILRDVDENFSKEEIVRYSEGIINIASSTQYGRIIHLLEFDEGIYVDGYPIWKEIQIGDTRLLLYTTQGELDELTKEYIYSEVHTASYRNNEYIWINEILNYEGGDDYAIRIANSENYEIEGTLLSTYTTDIEGTSWL